MSARRPLALGLLLLAACGGDDNAEPMRDAAADAALEDAQPDAKEAEFEGCPDTIPAFALGMQAQGKQGKLTAKLISASRVPPLRYLNDWTVELGDAAGAALEDATIRSALPFMPVHGHDGNVQPVVKKLSQPGRFAVSSLNFNMRGPWEVRLLLRSPSAGDDDVVFEICVAE
jgi:hypothetical protein